MKKHELPQDKGHLENFTREILYVKNDAGKYEADLSTGWDVKTDALDHAWQAIDDRISNARDLVRKGKASPIVYYLEKSLMDLTVLSGYTGFYRWQIKRHMKPAIFAKLKGNKLMKYTEAFGISMDELKNPDL